LVLHCGIDLTPFRPAGIDRSALGIPRDAFVVGHVGRFVALKNHGYLLQLFRDVLAQRPDAWLVLVGDGALRATVTAQAAALGIAHRVVFTGQRNDVAQLVKGAFDLFVMPSLAEGLPLSLLEAQAAGVRCLASDIVPAETEVIPGYVQRLALSAGPAHWADAVVRTAAAAPSHSPAAALAAVERSSFSIAASTRALEDVYARAN
jgi:glycosyltransferase involved in cell wall biosynthesis